MAGCAEVQQKNAVIYVYSTSVLERYDELDSPKNNILFTLNICICLMNDSSVKET